MFKISTDSYRTHITYDKDKRVFEFNFYQPLSDKENQKLDIIEDDGILLKRYDSENYWVFADNVFDLSIIQNLEEV